MRALPLAIAFLFAGPASADDSGRLETALKEKGFRCMELPSDAGAICKQESPGISSIAEVWVVVPKGVSYQRNIYFAHGDLGRCPAGVGGESHLKEHVGKLRGLGAIAVIPKRSPSRSAPSLSALAGSIDQITGKRAPWGVVGHSWAGKLLPRQLSAAPELLGRVEKVLLLDAAFDVNEIMIPAWTPVLEKKRGLKIKAVSNETWAKMESFRSQINEKFPGTVTHKQIPGDHCQAARFFGEY